MFWTVLIWSFQYRDRGMGFAVEDDVEWPLVLTDGTRRGWPSELLRQSVVRFEREENDIATVAITDTVRALWGESETPLGPVKLFCALEVDYLKPPFVYVSGRVMRIRLLEQRHEISGRRSFAATWVGYETRDLTQAPVAFRVVPAGPHRVIETGLLVTLDISGGRFGGRGTATWAVDQPGG